MSRDRGVRASYAVAHENRASDRDQIGRSRVFADQMRIPSLILLLALSVVAPSATAFAGAAGDAAELRVPAPLPKDVEERRAMLIAALDAELQPAFFAAVGDASTRLLASQRAAAAGEGEAMSARDAVRAALVDAGFPGIKSKKAGVSNTIVDLALLQLGAQVNATLRDGVGRHQAIRAVRACGADTTCLDGITATEVMTVAHVSAVRKRLAGKALDLGAAEIATQHEVQTLSLTLADFWKALSDIVKAQAETQKAILQNIR